MLRGADNSIMYSDYLDIIRSNDTRQAYVFLVGWASTLRDYECLPLPHGHIRSFRFMQGSDWVFAFIPNQNWLLFYFRKPCFRQSKYSPLEILGKFPTAEKIASTDEYKVKIWSLQDAVQLAAYIEN